MGVSLRSADRAVVCEGGFDGRRGFGAGIGCGEWLGVWGDAQLGIWRYSGFRVGDYSGFRVWDYAWNRIWSYSWIGVWAFAGKFFADCASSAAAAVIDRGFRG